MFGKISRRDVAHHFNKAKNFLGNAYHHTRNCLGDVDHGVRTFKHIYGAIAPVLDSYGVNPANQHVMKAFNGYAIIRSNVMDQHDRVINDVNNVRNNLVKKNVNFDF